MQTRIQSYQNEPPEKLNEDQKRLLKTLPVLEAVSKELEEVKKAIEVSTVESVYPEVILMSLYLKVHESEVAQELAFLKAEAARAEAERIREAVAVKEVCSISPSI